MTFEKYEVIIASDVNARDGIGIEMVKDGEVAIEIFRDDKEKTRTITTHKNKISLDLMEATIKAFKKEIPWEFIND